MGSLESYSVLMLVNSEQEQSIKELFEKKQWIFKCKVLPSNFSYLWTEENAENTSQPRIVVDAFNVQGKKETEILENQTNMYKRRRTKNDKGKETNASSFPCIDQFHGTQKKNPDNIECLAKTAVKHKVNSRSEKSGHDSDTDDCEMKTETDKEMHTQERQNKEVKVLEMVETVSVVLKEHKHRRSISSRCMSRKSSNDTKLKPKGNCAKFKRKIMNIKREENNKQTQDKVNSDGSKVKTDKQEPSSEKCSGCGKAVYKRNNQTYCRFCREKCQFCDKTYAKTVTGLRQLEIHSRKHKGLRPYVCTECKKDFTSYDYLLKHKNRKHNPNISYHACKICAKSFTKESLRTHMINMHSERNKVFQCDLCGNCFRYKGSLTQHKISVHAEERKFTCDICSSTYTSSHNLRLHRVRHEEDQKEVCNICGKILQGKGCYREHMKRHANQRQYPCSKCSKSFYGKRDLYTHNRIHTGEKPYKCHICTYACAIKGNLTKHMKRHRNGDYIPEHRYKGHHQRVLTEKTDIKVKAYGKGDGQNDTGSGFDKDSFNNYSSNMSEINTLGCESLKSDINNEEASDSLARLESISYANTRGIIALDTNTVENVYSDSKRLETIGLNCDNPAGVSISVEVTDFSNRAVCQISNMNGPDYGIVQMENSSGLYQNNQALDQESGPSLYHNDTYY